MSGTTSVEVNSSTLLDPPSLVVFPAGVAGNVIGPH